MNLAPTARIIGGRSLSSRLGSNLFNSCSPLRTSSGVFCSNLSPKFFHVNANCSFPSSQTPSPPSFTHLKSHPLQMIRQVFSHAMEQRAAVHDVEGTWLYSDLLSRAINLSHLLGNIHGERVSYLTPNDHSYMIVQWAIWLSGGVAVPLCIHLFSSLFG